MGEHNSNMQGSAVSWESGARSVVDTPALSQSESSILGYANAPPPYRGSNQIPNQVPIIGHANAPPLYQGPNQPLSQRSSRRSNRPPNHCRVSLHNWPCSSIDFIPPTTYQQYIVGCRTTDVSKERLERDVYEVRKTLRSFGASEEEFQAALAEYVAIKHEILELEVRHACARRAWRFVQEEERERLLRLEEEFQ